MQSLRDEAWDDLFSGTCKCGSKKAVRQSFCRACYFELPQNMRNDLYKSMSDGYSEAYDAAKDWLKTNTKRLNKAYGLSD